MTGKSAPSASAGLQARRSTAAGTATAIESACQSTGAHEKHAALGLGCQVCHPCGGNYGFGSVTFPGGTTTADGTITRDGPATTCSVGCHNPFRTSPQPVAWNAGPLQCTSCHSDSGAMLPSGTGSSHAAGASSDCTACHDQSRHTTGQVLLVTGSGASTTASCVGCHSGQGQTLAGRTPPLLVGWTDTVNGDFHGARAGNGFGGTLKAPYVRSQAALACADCHGVHVSSNAFLFAATVNGTVIPAGSIDRAGVGAESLCNACHEGDRHAACKTCHRAGINEDSEGFRTFDASTPVVDPAPDGSACFVCHGHEGIQYMADFFPVTPPWYTYQNPNHTWLTRLPTGSEPPQIQQGSYSYAPSTFDLRYYPQQPNPPVWLYPDGTVFNVTSTTATIYWQTNEPATGYVEYGVGTAGFVIGSTPFAYISADPADPYRLGWVHRVELTGLTPDTAYVWRVRSSDVFRRVTEAPLQTFTTVDPAGPPAPVLVREPDQYDSGGSGNDPTVSWTASQPLQWQPVTAPNDDAAQYRMQLGTDPRFGSVAVDTGWTSATSHPLALTSNLATCTQWYWRVMSRDTVTGLQSIWSVETYSVCAGDPYNDY